MDNLNLYYSCFIERCNKMTWKEIANIFYLLSYAVNGFAIISEGKKASLFAGCWCILTIIITVIALFYPEITPRAIPEDIPEDEDVVALRELYREFYSSLEFCPKLKYCF